MTDAQQREAARQFYYKWNGKGQEDEDARSYWIDILQNILAVDNVTDRVEFEKKVKSSEGTKRIDVYIPETHVLIEQKSLGIPLDKPQSGHGGKTPYEQAKEYDNLATVDHKANWIVTSNFAEIWIYNCHEALPKPVKLKLSDLQSKYHMLEFLVNKAAKKVTDEMQISLQAGEIVGLLYDAFHKQYKNQDDPETLKSLNKLCVRIVFCLYSEDAGVFGKKSMFHDYMEQFDVQHARKGLRDLFRVLNQKSEEREEFLSDDDPMLAAFPYVNGGLFADDDVLIPPFTDEIMDLILRKASDDFDWSGISPTIFGAVFESTLNPETRRSGGMHYTSIENIHKVIDPLFLDDLKMELEDIKAIAVTKTRDKRLHELQDKLASLSFLDPAAGSGNFLTESFLCIRKLENEIISLLHRGQIAMGEALDPIKVSISQFYGIEINDFAVTVARTALWIAENQMMKATEDIVHMSLDFLPLKTNAHIVEANALRIDWNDVVSKEKLNYIMGNPPFVSKAGRTPADASHSKGMLDTIQKEDKQRILGKNSGILDYVACWYRVALDYIKGTAIKVAFVSTDSICQGQQVAPLWKPLIAEGLKINYAYRFFKWSTEASGAATVFVIIVGFSEMDIKPCFIFEGENKQEVDHINPYLLDIEDIIVESRNKPICNVPVMGSGNQPIDGGIYLFDENGKKAFLIKEPKAEPYFHPWIGADEFLKGKKRYILYLDDCPIEELYSMPECLKKVKEVRAYRLSSSRAATIKLADTPTRFQVTNLPTGDYIALPEVSAGSRRYIPMGFMDGSVICSNKMRLVPNASLYHFGILASNVHMAWVRTVGGFYGPSYQYSVTVIYNSFPWPSPTEEQRALIEQTANTILEVRKQFSKITLEKLYDPDFMPDSLRKAHQANDCAVMQAYGMPIKETDEASCVAWLMRLYQQKVAEL